MRTHAPMLVFLACLTTSVAAQSPPPATTQPSAAAPFLWIVDGPGGRGHLFGTIHLGVGPDELPASVWEALRSSRSVILEADLRAIDPLGILAQVMLPVGQQLAQHFEPAVWQQLVARTAHLMPESMLNQYQPWFVHSMIVASVLPTIEPIDMRVLTDAAANGQSLHFLETVDHQMALMNATPVDAFIDDLVEYATTPEVVEAETRDLVAAYRAGDAAGMQAILFDPEDVAAHPGFYEVLLYARTRDWVPAVEEQLGQGGAFVAVGLGHLLGEQGLVELLRQRGYTVTRVAP